MQAEMSGEACVDFRKIEMLQKPGLLSLNCLVQKPKSNHAREFFVRCGEIGSRAQMGRKKGKSKRIILAPGGGFSEKCWGDENFSRLLQIFLEETNHKIAIIGSHEDKKRIQANAPLSKPIRIEDFCGKFSLSQSAALVAQSDFVLSNSSSPCTWPGLWHPLRDRARRMV